MKNKIKILYTIPNFDTAGSGKVVYDLVDKLDTSKFAPEICVFHTEGPFFKEIEKLGVPIHVFPFSAEYRPFYSLLVRIFTIKKFFKKNKFDIIHSWHWNSNFTEAFAAKWASIPYVFTKKNMGWGNKSWRIKSKLSTKIISINKDMKHLFFKEWIKKVLYIPVGIDTSHYAFQEKNYSLDHFNFSNNDFIVVSVVNMAPVKGIEVLIEAIIQIKKEGIPVQLLIVGNDQNDYAQQLKQSHKDLNFIHFLGKKIDVRPYLSVSNVFVIPSIGVGEGQGVAPLEAMAMKIPVLGSNIEGIRDVLEGFDDFLFSPGNSEELAQKLIGLNKMEQEDYNRIALKMQQQTHEIFNSEVFIKKHEALYIDLISD